MTVPSAICTHIYQGNGLNREWPWSFTLPSSGGVADTSVIQVWFVSAEGVPTQLLPSVFTVDAANKKIIYPKTGAATPAVQTGEKIVLRRVVPELQLMDLEDQGAFKAEVIEASDDSLEMQIQQLQEETDRSVKAPIGSSPDDIEKFVEKLFEAADRAEEAAGEAETQADRSEDEADRAEGEADRAKTEADRAKTEADRTDEIAKHHAYNFGRFVIDGADLKIEFVGDTSKLSQDTFQINDDGECVITIT